MSRLLIKVCGITRVKDAKASVSLGADLLGFIFYKKSPRYITPAKVLKIVSSIPVTTRRVGVFVNENNEKILSIANRLQLDFIQLSGDETKKDIRFLQKNGYKVIKTVRISSNSEISSLKATIADIVHLDTADKKLYGGVGKQFNWDTKTGKVNLPLMLAGGINKENVLEGIKKIQPIIVDVNSGVESKPGIKSELKLKEFFKTVDRYRYGKKT